jgi:ribosomal protein S12 methylthiotransferase accessory factor
VISLIEDRNFDPPLFAIGGACRVRTREALTKALIESVQGWAWARYHRLREGALEKPPYSEIDGFEKHVRLYACCDMRAEVSFLLNGKDVIKLSEWSSPQDEYAADDWERALEAVRETGTDIIALDMTTDDVRDAGFHVTRVFCPIFEQVEGDHNFPLLGGRRWRDVPVALGHRSRALELDEIYTIPHPYP